MKQNVKQNITLALDKRLLRVVRAHAAQRGTSVSAMLAEELETLVAREAAYEVAKAKALAQIEAPFRLGGERIIDRAALHDRKNLR